MKSKELKNYNLPDNRTYNETLEAKPIGLFLVLMGIGFILLLSRNYIYGGALFFFSAACVIVLPNRKIIEFYDTYMIVYNKANKNECNIIYYEDIKTWEYKVTVSDDKLIMNLVDGSVQTCDAYSKVKFEKYLNKYMKDKRIEQKAKKYRKQEIWIWYIGLLLHYVEL